MHIFNKIHRTDFTLFTPLSLTFIKDFHASLQGMKSAKKICLPSSKDNRHYLTTANLVKKKKNHKWMHEWPLISKHSIAIPSETHVKEAKQV